MNIEITGRGVGVNPKHRTIAEEGIERIVRILGETISAHIVLGVDKYRCTAEATVTAASEVLVGKCEGTELYTVLHDALKRVESQAVKLKERRLTVERHAKPDSAAPLVEVLDAT